jgi:PEP-CTERM motif
MNIKRTLALLGAALLLSAANASVAAAELAPFRKAYAFTQHCCWDAVYNYEWRQGGAASYSAASWSARADASGSLDYGVISADMVAYGNRNGYVYVNAIAEARDYWVDSFTISSATLPAGTPVELQLGVQLRASLATSGFGQAYALAVIGTGLDAGWLNGVDTRNVGGGSHSSVSSFMSYVGAEVTFVGQLNSRAWAESGEGVGSATTDAWAGFTVDLLTPGASYRTASGHDYGTPAAPIPEPGSWALLLGGIAALAWRRRHAVG